LVSITKCTFISVINFFCNIANGNEGENGGSTVNSPATCKNGVSVGASLNDHNSWQAYAGKGASSEFGPQNMALFTSRGPTSDGRLKPDILAPGTSTLTEVTHLFQNFNILYKGWWTTSAASKVTENGETSLTPNTSFHCTLAALRGTSMASPTAAGQSVLGTNIRFY
jgi:subtilisin family serine protease